MTFTWLKITVNGAEALIFYKECFAWCDSELGSQTVTNGFSSHGVCLVILTLFKNWAKLSQWKKALDIVMVIELGLQTITSEFDSCWVRHISGFHVAE